MMALGDDEIVPCGCGFDDVSYPHDCKTSRAWFGERRITEPQYSKLIDYIKDTIKKHQDYMDLIKNITGHDIEYSKGSIDAYSSVLSFIQEK